MMRLFLLLVLCAGCSSAGSVEAALAAHDVNGALRVYRAEHEHEALRAIAEHVLITDARAADAQTSTRAWALLRGLGAAGLAAWDELEREPGDHYVARVRAEALAARAALGDAPARRALRALSEQDDPELVALAVAVLDAEADLDALRRFASDPSASVRNAAVQRLALADADAATFDLLDARARLDPVASVRASAARALVGQGAPAIKTLEALSDEPAAIATATPADPKAGAKAPKEEAQKDMPTEQARDAADADRVRAAALGSLAELAPERASSRIAALLAGAPSTLSLQVAQDVLARPNAIDASLPPAALAHIAHALAQGPADATPARLLRERAALAAGVAAGHPAARGALLPALEAQLALERDRPARLLLALAKQRLARAEDSPELAALAQGEDVVAAQAAGELALRSRAARERLNALASSKDESVRASVASASAAAFDFERTPQSAPSLRALQDPQARVRTPAAAALLRTLERLRAATGR